MAEVRVSAPFISLHLAWAFKYCSYKNKKQRKLKGILEKKWLLYSKDTKEGRRESRRHNEEDDWSGEFESKKGKKNTFERGWM